MTDTPSPVERVGRTNNLMNNARSSFSQYVAINKEVVLKEALPPGAGIELVSAAIYPGGREVYSLAGNPILEIFPLEVENVREDDSFKMKVTMKWRKIQTP